MDSNLPVPNPGKANVPSIPSRRKSAIVKKFLVSVGLWELAAQSIDWGTNEAAALYDRMFESGIDPEVAATVKAGGREVGLVELARSGIDFTAESLAKAGLKEKDIKTFLSMSNLERLKSGVRNISNDVLGEEFKANVDANQADSATIAEDDDVIRLKYIKRMSDVARSLGFSGVSRFRELYDLSLVINTIQEANVGDAEKHERIMGSIR